MNPESCTYIVILNWNGWQDTIECLESVFASEGDNYRVIVCDNGSLDGSLEHIAAWADGSEPVNLPARFDRLVTRTRQPVPYTCTTPDNLGFRVNTPLVLLDNDANLGFAAGNNTGIRLALNQPDMTHVWLLNNDTLIEKDALTALLRRVSVDEGIGCCGSLIKFHDDPSVIQAVGGCRFNLMTGTASQTLGRYLPDSTPLDVAGYQAEMDYISGASMLVTRPFLEAIGLMAEHYFLYYEEIDWAVRAAGRFRLAIAADSIVYHKEGSAIGSASLNRAASPQSEFYLFRSKLRFMATHRRWWLPLCYLASFAQALNRFRRGQTANGRIILSLLISGTA